MRLTALKGSDTENVCKLGLASKKFVKIKFITKEQYGEILAKNMNS